jgi:hypothetical protein
MDYNNSETGAKVKGKYIVVDIVRYDTPIVLCPMSNIRLIQLQTPLNPAN